MTDTLIAIITCGRNLEKRNAIRDTWMPWVKRLNSNVDVCFFMGNVSCPDFSVGDIVQLDCPDDYEHLPTKTLALVVYAAKRYSRIIKVDDDTYLLPTHGAVENLSSAMCVGSARRCPPWNDRIDYAQGGCYSLGEDGMSAVILNVSLFDTGMEDATVGRALHAHGIPLTHSNRIKTDFRHGVPAPGNDIIAAHKVTPDIMHQIHRNLELHLASEAAK
jgi:hypothetical protein